MHSTIGHTPEREDEGAARVPSARLAQLQDAVRRDELAAAERREQHAGSLRRVYDRAQALRRWNRDRKPLGKLVKSLLALGLVGGLATSAVELIEHGHRELGTDFAVAAGLLLTLLIFVIFARHFLAQELE